MSTTCGRCPATWTGKRIEHCTVCHETFTGTAAGDKHRVGSHWPDERRCLTPEEMRAKGMRQNDRGQWGLGGVSPWAQGAESAATSSLRTPSSPGDVREDPAESVAPSTAGCYICRPNDPDAAEEGCGECEREFWTYYRQVSETLTAEETP